MQQCRKRDIQMVEDSDLTVGDSMPHLFEQIDYLPSAIVHLFTQRIAILLAIFI